MNGSSMIVYFEIYIFFIKCGAGPSYSHLFGNHNIFNHRATCFFEIFLNDHFLLGNFSKTHGWPQSALLYNI